MSLITAKAIPPAVPFSDRGVLLRADADRICHYHIGFAGVTIHQTDTPSRCED